jgi:hypothetical protein
MSWGSRVQISPARQVNIGLSNLIRAGFIRPPVHPRLASAPGSWAQIGPTSASTPPRHRARPGNPGEDNGPSPPGLDGRPRVGGGATQRRRRLSRSARRVSQAVSHETGQPKIINQLVTPRRIAQGRGRDHPSTRTNQQTSIWLVWVPHRGRREPGGADDADRPHGWSGWLGSLTRGRGRLLIRMSPPILAARRRSAAGGL